MKKTIFTLSFIVTAYILNAQVLYGTTGYGGNNNSGAICKLDAATNTLTAPFSFDAVDGRDPGKVKLLEASDGKLYGMTSRGGSNGVGTIFSYNSATATYTQLKGFDGTNGENPYGSLLQASDGRLYGMTSTGGSYDAGVIFSYNIATSTYTKLKDFDYTNGGNPYGDLVQASDGKLYGMTRVGGSNNVGVIFSYDPATAAYTKLKDFNLTNGGWPSGGLIQASDGKLYGMTYSGGSKGVGVIFSYDPTVSTYTKLRDFDSKNGANPSGNLVQASDGKLYGMTYSGGTGFFYGVIFSYDPPTSTYTKLKDFDYTNGTMPLGSLIQASDGKLYGMTKYGGSNAAGVIFSYDIASSAYTKLKDFDNTNGANPEGSLAQASDGNLFGVTREGGSNDYGVIFSFKAATSTYTKLRDFGTNNTGHYIGGALIKGQSNKLYGMTYQGGSYGAGTIFSYDANTVVFTKLKDFDGINGANPLGSLVQASDGKLYGMTPAGGSVDLGVIFSYDPATSAYTKLIDLDYTTGAYPYGSLVQASDGKLYGMTSSGGLGGYIFSYDAATSTYKELKGFDGANGESPFGSLIQASDGKLYGVTSSGGSNNYGVIFSYNIATLVYTKLKDFDGVNGASPYGDLVQASDGKLYGMTSRGGSSDSGVIFSYDPAASTYTKLIDFDGSNGSKPLGSLIQASDGKLYGMTNSGGNNGYGVNFSYDPASSTYTKLSDFNGGNGSYPQSTSFIEIPDNGGIQISIADKSVIEGNRNKNLIFIPIVLSERSEKIIRLHYTTQDSTAAAGSDYIAQSGTLIFPAGIKRIVLPLLIKGDEIPEANETFKIILSNPVNATIADSTSIVTISDDDALALNASQKNINTTRSITLSPNPAQDKVTVRLKGYSGNTGIQLSSFDGKILQQQKLQAASAKIPQQSIDVSAYANGVYLVTVVDENGTRKTEKLVIRR